MSLDKCICSPNLWLQMLSKVLIKSLNGAINFTDAIRYFFTPTEQDCVCVHAQHVRKGRVIIPADNFLCPHT